MSYIIFGDDFTFPDGNAATNRTYTYAKGFVEHGRTVYVLPIGNNYQDDKEGQVEGINYYVPFRPVYRNKYFVIRNISKITKYFHAVRYMFRIHRKDPLKAIIVYSRQINVHLIAYFVTRCVGAKLIIENSEHPLRYHYKGWVKKALGRIRLYVELHTFDGIMLISNILINFYKDWIRDQKKILLVPSTVDPSRFALAKSGKLPYEYIGYFGGINFDRDRVDVLIKAFAQLKAPYDLLHLVMGGYCVEANRLKVLNLIDELDLGERVHLLDMLPREEIAQYLVDAKVLVLVRSDDEYTRTSYPSKLTEYLATGNPVISQNVGEITLYLTDRENVFLIDKSGTSELYGKLIEVLSDYTQAMRVGEKGRKLTYETFNYKYQAGRILDFIENLK